MPNCIALKQNLQRCSHYVARDGDMCGTHVNSHAARVLRSGPRPEGTCVAYLTAHRWCGHPKLPDQDLCEAHQRRQAEAAVQDNDDEVFLALLNANPVLPWREVMDAVLDNFNLPPVRAHRVALRYFRWRPAGDTLATFGQRWGWVMGGRLGNPPPIVVGPLLLAPVHMPAPVPPPLPVLGHIANDNQNVHTRFVTEQTNSALEKILKANVPKTQTTQSNMTFMWLYDMPETKRPKFNHYLAVITDVHKWFATKTCRTPNDQLYYRTLRGLVALINQKDEETRKELFNRLWEECCEAVDMCCDGHITRLCNVLVGFDDEFKPQVAFGEILQNKMSAIASSSASEEEKRNQANAFFDEHAVPQVERVAWLEAF